MKLIVLFIAIFVLVSCAGTKKTAAVKNAPSQKVTSTDVLKGGTSFENAIIIRVQTESAGVAEEFKWLGQSYPGYSTIRKVQTSRGGKHYDIITFKTRDGIEKIAYFDITSFFGK